MVDVISSIKFENVLNIPSEVIIEGGDVTIFKNHISLLKVMMKMLINLK